MHTAKIDNIEALTFSVPFFATFRSGLKMTLKQANNVLVKVTASDGTMGFAEGMAFAELLGESQESIAWAVENWIAPRLKGLPLFALEKIWDQMDVIRANNTAKGSVDIAIHDAQAKSLGIPLYKLLGGWTDRIPLTWIIGQAGTEEMIEEAVEAKGKGFTSFKIKVGLNPRKDVEAIRLLREALGAEVLIYVDANQAYSYPDACRFFPMMEEYGIAMVEDPMPARNREGRLRLSRKLSVPVIGDESVPTLLDVGREIDLGAITVFNIKTPRTGYFQSRKVVHLVEQVGLSCIMGTLLETDIGALASAHFGAAFRAFAYPAEIAAFLKMEDHLLKESLKIENGVLILPDKPGLGIELDEGKIKRYHRLK